MALSGQHNPDTFEKFFVPVFLFAGACVIGRAFVTGSVKLAGEKEPIRRQDKPREFRQAMGILTVIFIIIAAVLTWIFVIPSLISKPPG